jgi:hypothetical protein
MQMPVKEYKAAFWLHAVRGWPWLNIGLFAALAVLAAAVNLRLGKDYSWDLRNYHFYNAWAFFQHRLDKDFLPANLQGYNNPVIEFPFFALIRYHAPDYVTGALMGLPTAIVAFTVWKITRLWSTSDWRPTVLNRSMCVLAAVTGAAGWCQWGTTSGEWPVTALCIIALFIVARRSITTWSIPSSSLCGLLLGCACGLKLTAIPFAVGISIGFVFSCVTVYKGRSGFFLMAFALAGIAGFVILELPWAWQLHSRFGNPLFPYFNGIFKSDLIAKSNWRDERFLPLSVTDVIAAPFNLAFKFQYQFGDSHVQDPRTLVGFCATALLIICRIGRRNESKASRLEGVFAAIFVSSFIAWAVAFSYYRYAIGIEVTASILLFMLIWRALELARPWFSALSFGLYVPLAFMQVSSLGRVPFTGGPYFSEQLPAMPAGSLVINLIATDPPLGYLSPLLGKQVTVVKPYSNLSSPVLNTKLQDDLDRKLALPWSKIYIVAKPPLNKKATQYLRNHGLGVIPDQTCDSIVGLAYRLDGYICEARRIDSDP